MRAKKIILLVVGVPVGLLGLALGSAGGFLTWVHATQRDDGYITTDPKPFATGESALVSEALDLALGTTGGPGDWVPDLGDITMRIRFTGGEAESLFVGIAPSSDADAYLDGIGHSVITEVSSRPFRVSYREESGPPPTSSPGDETFWVAQSSGSGTQTLLWDVREGDWTVVAMNADGSPGVAVEAAVGAKAGFFLPLALGLLFGGLLILAIGTLMVVAGAMVRPRRPEQAAAPDQPAPVTAKKG